MYNIVLSLHSLFRWLVLLSLLVATCRAYLGWHSQWRFLRADNLLRRWTTTFAHVQLVIGLCLYFISPVVNYFLHNYKEAVHMRAIRFFGMEHSLMMLISVVLITIGSVKVKRQPDDAAKFKTIAIWFGIALLVILVNIPWTFSPFASRPLFRSVALH